MVGFLLDWVFDIVANVAFRKGVGAWQRHVSRTIDKDDYGEIARFCRSRKWKLLRVKNNVTGDRSPKNEEAGAYMVTGKDRKGHKHKFQLTLKKSGPHRITNHEIIKGR